MRVLLIVILLLLICLALFSRQPIYSNDSADETLDVNMLGRGLLDSCISRCLNVSTRQISELRAQGFGDTDIAAACAISIKSAQPITGIVAKFRECEDWQRIAGMHNLSTADLSSAPFSTSADTESFNTEFFSRYYSISKPEIANIRRKGCSWEDINICANAATCASRPLSEITGLRSQGLSWAEIGNRYGISTDKLTTPVSLKIVSVEPSVPGGAAAGPGSMRP
ncbi:MAG: hypothetical protein ACOX3G_09290 [Armatimonadota bacterium]